MIIVTSKYGAMQYELVIVTSGDKASSSPPRHPLPSSSPLALFVFVFLPLSVSVFVGGFKHPPWSTHVEEWHDVPDSKMRPVASFRNLEALSFPDRPAAAYLIYMSSSDQKIRSLCHPLSSHPPLSSKYSAFPSPMKRVNLQDPKFHALLNIIEHLSTQIKEPLCTKHCKNCECCLYHSLFKGNSEC